MIIIETCPECGYDLVNSVICTNPPIPKKECHNCGWTWEGQREELVRVPFNSEDKVIYNDKKFKIDYVRDNGTAKIHSIQGKVNEVNYYADTSKMELIK